MRNNKSLLSEYFIAVCLVAGIVISVLLGFLNYSPIYGYALTFIPVLWYLVKLGGRFLWSEPEVNILYSKEQVFTNGELYLVAQLEIINLEELKITNCYATLESASDVHWSNGWQSTPLIPSMFKNPDRITWIEDKYSNESCAIEIPPKNSRCINLADTLGEFHYNLCSGKLPAYNVLDSKVHEVRIRIDGDFDGKSMKPLYFDGYIYYEKKSLIYGYEDIRGGEFTGNYKEKEALISNMIFGKGNWIKDEKVHRLLKSS